LQTGTAFRESGTADSDVSLEAILADIQAYAAIFSPDQLSKLDATIVEAVKNSLIDKLGEQIVEVYPLKQPPVNASFRGQFKSGAVVLTNIRVLVPFLYEWQERSGNTTTTYKGLQAMTAAWPLITGVQITVCRRLSTDVLVVLRQADSSVAFKAARHNLTELLLIANLWGVPVAVSEEDSRATELRSSVFRPWQILAWVALAAVVIAGVIGFFSDSGITGLPIDLLTWSNDRGLLQISFLLGSLWTARGLARWIASYTPRGLVDMIASTPVVNEAPLAERPG